jgi:hypothetical protein
MRILTVQQPWAWAIFHGKGVENRTKNLAGSWRGTVAIHAGKRLSERGCELIPDLLDPPHIVPYIRAELVYGAILGTAELVDVHPDADECCTSEWAESSYVEHGGRERHHIWHHVLENAVLLDDPIPAVGGLGLRTIKDPEVLDQLRMQVA